HPMGTPSGALGQSNPGKFLGAGGMAEAELKAATRGLHIDPRARPVSYERPGPIENPYKRLPPAPEEVLNPPPKASFIATPSGEVVPAGNPLSGPLARGAAIMEEGRPSANPRGNTADIDALKEARRIAGLKGSAGWNGMVNVGEEPGPISLPSPAGDTTGGFARTSTANLPYQENIAPEAVRPRTAQSDVLRTAPDRISVGEKSSTYMPKSAEPLPAVEPIREPNTPSYPGSVGEPEVPSAPKTMK